MKALTREWLERAADDLNAARLLLESPDLTHLTAFHAQQVVEKTLKAVIEEGDLGAVRTHSLTRLLDVVRSHVNVDADLDMRWIGWTLSTSRRDTPASWVCCHTGNPPPRMPGTCLPLPVPSTSRWSPP